MVKIYIFTIYFLYINIQNLFTYFCDLLCKGCGETHFIAHPSCLCSYRHKYTGRSFGVRSTSCSHKTAAGATYTV